FINTRALVLLALGLFLNISPGTVAAAETGQMPEAFKQALALVRAGKLAEAEQPLNRLLNQTNDSGLPRSEIVTARGFLRAVNCRFEPAISDLQDSLASDPADHELWFLLTPLFVQTGQLEEYRRHCGEMMMRFRQTTNAVIAERTAKCYLLLSTELSPSDLESAAKLAQFSVTSAKKDEQIPWRRMTLGLSEYRQGKHAKALKTLELAEKEVLQTYYVGHDMCRADSWFISAMAHAQLKQAQEAKTAFAHGRVIVQTKLPSLTSQNLGFGWVDVLMTYALMREAETMLGPDAAPKPR
ncbi:MAG TPA: hypothetical protein VLT36_11595, partial [Candidatus Dormibacteraeota bacterium]|nr:hypothetical protein [Candidatus Dormibacteraeota bacterium]